MSSCTAMMMPQVPMAPDPMQQMAVTQHALINQQALLMVRSSTSSSFSSINRIFEFIRVVFWSFRLSRWLCRQWIYLSSRHSKSSRRRRKKRRRRRRKRRRKRKGSTIDVGRSDDLGSALALPHLGPLHPSPTDTKRIKKHPPPENLIQRSFLVQ